MVVVGMKYVLAAIAARDNVVKSSLDLDLDSPLSRHTREILHQMSENRRIASLKTVSVSRQRTSVPPYWAVGG